MSIHPWGCGPLKPQAGKFYPQSRGNHKPRHQMPLQSFAVAMKRAIESAIESGKLPAIKP